MVKPMPCLREGVWVQEASRAEHIDKLGCIAIFPMGECWQNPSSLSGNHFDKGVGRIVKLPGMSGALTYPFACSKTNDS